MVGMIITGCGSQTVKTSPEMPNPYLTAQGTSEVVFYNLESVCTIEIYTLAGEAIRTISVVEGNGQVSWDLKNNNGELLVSGTYGYLITNPGTKTSGKIVIIK